MVDIVGIFNLGPTKQSRTHDVNETSAQVINGSADSALPCHFRNPLNSIAAMIAKGKIIDMIVNFRPYIKDGCKMQDLCW